MSQSSEFVPREVQDRKFRPGTTERLSIAPEQPPQPPDKPVNSNLEANVEEAKTVESMSELFEKDPQGFITNEVVRLTRLVAANIYDYADDNRSNLLNLEKVGPKFLELQQSQCVPDGVLKTLLSATDSWLSVDRRIEEFVESRSNSAEKFINWRKARKALGKTDLPPLLDGDEDYAEFTWGSVSGWEQFWSEEEVKMMAKSQAFRDSGDSYAANDVGHLLERSVDIKKKLEALKAAHLPGQLIEIFMKEDDLARRARATEWLFEKTRFAARAISPLPDTKVVAKSTPPPQSSKGMFAKFLGFMRGG